jgi:hypothetical protein
MKPRTLAKHADLASSAGAGLLGAGVGAMLAQYVGTLAFGFVLVGMALHGWGMVTRHRLEANAAQPAWSKALYWGCWAALAILAGWIALSILKE